MTTKYQRPEGAYSGNTALTHRDKYQLDSNSQPKVSISSAKIDGDFNYIIDALNDMDQASGSRSSIDERLSVALNADGTLKSTDITVTLGEWVQDSLLPSLSRVDNSTLSFAVDSSGIYVGNRRVKLEFSSSAPLYATVHTCVFDGTLSLLELVDITDAAGTVSVITEIPTALFYSSLKTGDSGSMPVRFEELHTQGLVTFDEGLAVRKFALRVQSGVFEIVENTGTAETPVWQTRAEVDSAGLVIADGSIPFSKIDVTSIATQAEAEAGIVADKLMTPERTLQFLAANEQPISGKNPIYFNSNTGEISIAGATHSWSGATQGVSIDNARLGGEGGGMDSSYISRECLPYHPLTPKAWVSFIGTGTVEIQDAWHVSSVTDMGTGHYRVNFDMTMQNTNYAVVASGRRGALVTSTAGFMAVDAVDVSYCDVSTWTASSIADWPIVNVMVIGAR